MPSQITQSRGFALPVVIILILIVGMVAGVLLQRQASDRLVVERRLTWYREHHAQAGLEEIIDGWLRSLPRNVRLDRILDEAGYAMTIDMRDGTEALLYIRDGQGSILTDGLALPPSERERVEAIAARFDQLVGEGNRPLERRTVGPPKLCLQSASSEAIEATASVIAGPASGAAFAEAIIDIRGGDPDGEVSNDTLTLALGAAEMSAEDAQQLRAAFTLQPTLYFVSIELRPKGAMRRRDRGSSIFFGGYIPVSNSRSAAGAASFNQRSGFLSFERLPVQY